MTVKVSEVCPFCKKPVQGPFSLIVKDFWSYLKGRFNKVHLRCLLQGASFVTNPPGMAQAYGGLQGRCSNWTLRSFGDVGGSMMSGRLDFMWGRFIQGYNPRLLLIQNILGSAIAIGLILIFIFLILSNPPSSIKLLFLILIPICIIIAVITFIGIRSIGGVMKVFVNQPF
jgi:hypothetical protein